MDTPTAANFPPWLKGRYLRPEFAFLGRLQKAEFLPENSGQHPRAGLNCGGRSGGWDFGDLPSSSLSVESLSDDDEAMWRWSSLSCFCEKFNTKPAGKFVLKCRIECRNCAHWKKEKFWKKYQENFQSSQVVPVQNKIQMIQFFVTDYNNTYKLTEVYQRPDI